MDDGLLSALRDNIVQKQAIIDKLVTENARLHERINTILGQFPDPILWNGGKDR